MATKVKKLNNGMFALQDEESGFYFIWCYSNEEYAHRVANKVTPGNANDIAANWRVKSESCIRSDRTEDD